LDAALAAQLTGFDVFLHTPLAVKAEAAGVSILVLAGREAIRPVLR
jgi:hypothetical protein